MKKFQGFILLFFFYFNIVSAQQFSLDSLQRQLTNANSDTSRIKLLISIANYYTFFRQDSSIYYATRAIELSEKTNYLYGSYEGYHRLSFVLNTSSNYSKALEMAMESLKIAERMKSDREFLIAESYRLMGGINRRIGNDSIAMQQLFQSIQHYDKGRVERNRRNFGSYMNIALMYLKWNKPDSALAFAKECYDVGLTNREMQISTSAAACTLAQAYEETGNIPLAQKYYLVGLEACKKYPGAKLLVSRFYNNYSRFFKKTGNFDSSVYYARLSLQLGQDNTFGEHTSDAAALLMQAYESQQKPDSALKYMKVFMALKDSIYSRSKLEQVQLLNFEEGQRQRDLDIAKERYKNRVRLYSLIAAVAIFLLVTIILYRNNRHKQRANVILDKQKNEIDKQRTKTEYTIQELKSAQAQLIQSEKMASLGELTAGIAHEIQNPLNFVNNFSEVNSELLGELKLEIEKNNINGVKTIVADLKENEEKIAHHGKRADSIVKGMLQHSRTSSGQEELTDINALADEYLRLSYHGMRARDKSFNAILQTDFDENIARATVMPQEIGRALLNLYNNAFYAVMQKQKKQIQHSRTDGKAYEPTVTVATKQVDNKIEIRVKDNGNGIPEGIKDKIFQPFFTTKGAGQGTGLGLSLVYDVVVKEHKGQIKVETRENHYTEFIIHLPLRENVQPHI